MADAAATTPGTSPLGSDLSALPRLYPDGEWLSIEAPLLSMELLVRVVVNGRAMTATLDTGAQATTLSEPVAEALGILSPDGPRGSPVHAIDAHGDLVRGERLVIGELALGRRAWRDVDVTVIGRTPGLFLIGADLLQHVDLFIAADEGLVGIFAAGTAPQEPGDRVVALQRGDRQLTVAGAADGRVRARFPMLVDTGAWNSSVPATTGINAGLPADLAYSAVTVGVAGEQENRGRFVLSPLLLGELEQPVGRVLAIASTIARGGGLGLLGNDVFFRFHTIVSFRDAALRFRALPPRGDSRPRGPGGATCGAIGQTPCVRVQLSSTNTPPAPDDLPGICLQVDVDGAYAGSTVELAITALHPEHVSLFNGGAIRAFMSVDRDGAHHCFTLWQPLERLGLRSDTPLSLRWVRTEGVRWPCDPMKTRCITFTGPLAQPAARRTAD
jgi:predicted aspartyl protease